LFIYIFIKINFFLKSKESNKVVKITKNKYATKILKYMYFAFLKVFVVINILII